MSIPWMDWLSLAIRWLHLAAGIAWIGTSFYFIWLDQSLRARDGLAKGVLGESWSVHGGGFYHVQKYSVAPQDMPPELHWFKYEAYFTWLSGFALLVVLYYFGASSYLIDPTRADLAPIQAIGASLGFLVGSWVIYEALCRSPIGRSVAALAVSLLALILLSAFLLTQIFSDRAAFLHVGALIGTIMSANVFVVIIPNQKKVVADLMAGKAPNPALGAQAKQRSLHNNYLTLPVLLLMVSAHYPMLYSGGAAMGWLVIALIVVIGGIVRHFFNSHHAGRRGVALMWQWPIAALLGVGLAIFINTRGEDFSATQVTDAQALAITQTHCAGCHAASPTHPAFKAPPGGIILDSLLTLEQHSDKVMAQAVLSQAMPLGNATHMTAKERAELGAWLNRR
ncbi:MAG: cysteine desulfurase [Gammaproteobacteria bacterium]|nr:cysteine desulfurase [Gammaproteobacteria bacterium]